MTQPLTEAAQSLLPRKCRGAGATRPTLWDRLKKILLRIGAFQSMVFLSVLYLVLWLPAGLIARLFVDWLCVKAPKDTNWLPRPERVNRPETLREPF